MPTVLDLNSTGERFTGSKELQSVSVDEVGQMPSGVVQMQTGNDLVSAILGGQTLTHSNINEVGMGSYIFNASDQSPSWASQQAAGMKNGEFGVMDNGSMIRVTPMKYFLLYSEGFQTNMNKTGQILGATQDMGASIDKYGEHYVSVLLVDTGSTLTPAKGEFRWAKAPTVRTAVLKLRQSLDPAWATSGEKEKFAAQVQLPFARVVHEATLSRKTSRSGPNAGNPYELAVVNSKPVDSEMLMKLQTALNDDKFKAKLTAVCNMYASKVNELKAMCK
jgi:hypothetical protein